MANGIRIIFFDIGETLGSVAVKANGELDAIEPYPYISPILESLIGFKLGIISNTGDRPRTEIVQALDNAGLIDYFDQNLLIFSNEFGKTKNSPEIFLHAANEAASEPANCLYVGEDSWERKQAALAGLAVCPHPILTKDVLKGEKLRYVRVSPPPGEATADLRATLSSLSFVPLYMGNQDRSKAIGIATNQALTALSNAQFIVELLGASNAPLFSDLYLLRDDKAAKTGYLTFEGQSSKFFGGGDEADWLLSSTPEGLLVAIPAGKSVEDYHFEETQHGHNLKLAPDLTLLAPFDLQAEIPSFAKVTAKDQSIELDASEKDILSELTKATIKKYLDPYVGGADIYDGGPRIISRHIFHPDNSRAVEDLITRFQSISEDLKVRKHPFTHEGKVYYNIEAELSTEPAAEIVIVSAHLDSTAKETEGYDPESDPAPGADDDASGIAGVLAIAEIIERLKTLKAPERTIKFLLFNAEEHGLVGSQAYARMQSAKNAPIIAVLQMDMIGYNVKEPRNWEIHAGYSPSKVVQQRSLELAEYIRDVSETVSKDLKLPQIYTSSNGLDPAEGRSDHAPFHERGYTACAASEDFFIGPTPDAGPPEPNKNYHKEKDTYVDLPYAADISRAIAAVTWLLARGKNVGA